MLDIDKLAKVFAELSGEIVVSNEDIDKLVEQYREGTITKKELLRKTWELLSGLTG